MLNRLKHYIVDKLNPSQPDISNDEGSVLGSSYKTYSFKQAYDKIEVVNRGCDLISESCAGIKVDVGDSITSIVPIRSGMRRQKLDRLLNFQPNPYQDANSFYRSIYLDLLLEGNAFIYFDGVYLYQLPANRVEVISDKRTFINSYKYAEVKYQADEILHIKENSSASIFRGRSRLESADNSVKTLQYMLNFQQNFFQNSAVPGLVLKSPNALGQKIKERILQEWTTNYNPKTGGRKPVILDADLTLDTLNMDYSKLDFEASVKDKEIKILEALGVPEILLNAGNNANINPNLRMFYLNTVLPLTEKLYSVFQVFFGYDLKAVIQDVQALRPELKDIANYLTSLTNAGIITRNEARESIRFVKLDDPKADELILPANIAGSAVDPGVGGAPEDSDNTDENSGKLFKIV